VKLIKKILFLPYLLFIVVQFSVAHENPPKLQAKLDSLKTVIETAEDDTVIVIAMQELAWELKHTLPDTSEAIGQNALILLGVLNLSDLDNATLAHPSLTSKVLNMLGVVKDIQSDYTKALDYYFKSLMIIEELLEQSGTSDSEVYRNAKNSLSSTYNNIGIIYAKQANYPKALNYFFKSLKAKEELGNKNIAQSYNNIGMIYFNQFDYPKAMEYHFKSLKIDEELGNRHGMSASYGNIGIIYMKQSDYSKALDYYFKALKIEEELGNKYGMSITYMQIGELFVTQDSLLSVQGIEVNFSKPIDYYLKANAIQEETGDKWGSVHSLGGIGDLYLKEKTPEEALPFLLESEAISLEIGTVNTLSASKESLSRAYEQLGQYDLSLEYYKQYTTLKDSIFNEKSTKEITQMSAQYEAEKREQEIELKENQNKLQKISLEKEKNKQYSLMGGLTLIIVLVLGITYRVRAKQNSNKSLEGLNEQVRKFNEEIEKTNLELEKLSLVAKETDNSVMIMNRDTKFEWVNEAFTRIEGFTLEEYKKRYGNSLLEASTNPEVKKVIEKCLESKQPQIYESECTTKDEKKLWMQSTLTPIIGVDKEIEKLVVIDTEITQQKEAEKELNEKVKQVTENIQFAQNIQASLLEDEKEIQKHLPESFLIYKPRDIVSGDFYYFAVVDEVIIYSVVDCTGHGVPGAMVSMIGNNILNRIIKEQGIINPSDILINLHEAIREDLRQSTEASKSKDGMDMSLCAIYPKERKVLWAGAGNPIYIFRKEIKVTEDDPTANLEITKGDIYGIGGDAYTDDLKFKTHEFNLNKGDSIYLLSDGFADQFGGAKGRRFTTKRMQQLIGNFQNLSMKEQKEKYDEIITRWMGKEEQIDDITLVGFTL